MRSIGGLSFFIRPRCSFNDTVRIRPQERGGSVSVSHLNSVCQSVRFVGPSIGPNVAHIHLDTRSLRARAEGEARAPIVLSWVEHRAAACE